MPVSASLCLLLSLLLLLLLNLTSALYQNVEELLGGDGEVEEDGDEEGVSVVLNGPPSTPDLVNTDDTLILFPGNFCSRTAYVCGLLLALNQDLIQHVESKVASFSERFTWKMYLHSFSTFVVLYEVCVDVCVIILATALGGLVPLDRTAVLSWVSHIYRERRNALSSIFLFGVNCLALFLTRYSVVLLFSRR